jgi:predicted amidohydrolase
MKLTIAGLQHPGHPGVVAENLAVIADAAAEARARGADVLVTPEMFVTGYNIGGRVAKLAADDLVGAVQQVAADAGIAIVAGLPEQAPSGGIWNTALLVDGTGAEVTRYRKTHLFGPLDRGLFVAGASVGAPVELGGVRISLLVCYDVEFPETVRAAVRAGADVVLVPTAQMEPYARIAEQLIWTRAWESQVYIAYVNRSGEEGELRYVGRSSIVSPTGEVLDALGPDTPTGLVVATVDTDVVARSRAENPYLDDLRRDLLGG